MIWRSKSGTWKNIFLLWGGDFEIIHDIGSGLNYKNKGLLLLLNRIINKEVSKIVVFYKDCLLRFGFELVEHVVKQSGCGMLVLSGADKSGQEEFVEDNNDSQQQA